MTMPNFIVIGARKAGTTSVARYLAQHPQVFVSPVKEPNFFAFEGGKPGNKRPPGVDPTWPAKEIDSAEEARSTVASGRGVAAFTTLDAYEVLFEGVSNEVAIGEASPLYLYSEKAPQSISRHLPEVLLIAVLRNPVERAFSDYMNEVRLGREPLLEFEQALAQEDERVRLNYGPSWHYKRAGYYFEQLKRYYDVFDPGQIKVILQEDLRQNSQKTMAEIFAFLNVDSDFELDLTLRHNIGGLPKNNRLYKFMIGKSAIKTSMKWLVPKQLYNRAWKMVLAKPTIADDTRRMLIEDYRQDLFQLQDLINRDLSGWLEPDPSKQTEIGEHRE